MRDYSMHNVDGMSESVSHMPTSVITDPRVVFISKQRHLQLFNDIGDTLATIDYAFIKGEALSLLAYGKLGARISADIDILLPKASLRTIEKALIAKGYKSNLSPSEQRSARILCLSYSHQLVPYRKHCKNLNTEIDLNFNLFWGEYGDNEIDISEFLSDIINIKIYGHNVKTLPPLKTMVQLVLHHYKEMNSIYHIAGHNSIKLNMFKDVYNLWKNNQDAIELDSLLCVAEKYRIKPYIYYIMFFTNKIYRDAEFSRYIDALKTVEGVELLDCYGLSDKERRQWKCDFKTRLESDNLYENIKDDLTKDDFEKIERNRQIFG